MDSIHHENDSLLPKKESPPPERFMAVVTVPRRVGIGAFEGLFCCYDFTRTWTYRHKADYAQREIRGYFHHSLFFN